MGEERREEERKRRGEGLGLGLGLVVGRKKEEKRVKKVVICNLKQCHSIIWESFDSNKYHSFIQFSWLVDSQKWSS